MIVGANGQDGKLLIRELIGFKNLHVYGVTKLQHDDFLSKNFRNVNFTLLKMESLNLTSIRNLIEQVKPHVIYYLAAANSSSQVMNSEWQEARKQEINEINVIVPYQFMTVIHEVSPDTIFLYCGSSKMFDAYKGTTEINESTPTDPESIYGITKSIGRQHTTVFRESHGLNTKCAILFNHESEFRKETFLFQKLAMFFRNFLVDPNRKLVLENPDTKGDWHSARDTVKGLILLANNSTLNELVLGSGQLRNIRQVIDDYLIAHDFNERSEDIIKVESREVPIPTVLKSDIALAKNYGWTPSESLVTVLCRMVGCHSMSD